MANIIDTALKMEMKLIRPRQVPTYSTTANSPRNTCLCCSNTLLRHIRGGGMYWRCGHCYQEMPVQQRRFTYACER